MIILITGATHTGKTKLAQRLLEKIKYPYLSIDHLKMGLIRSKNTDLTVEEDTALTNYLWPIIAEIVKTAIENKQNLIVEGCYMPFDWHKDFEKEYLAEIKHICLTMSESYITHYYDTIIEHCSDVESRLNQQYVTLKNLIEENQFFRQGYKQTGTQLVVIDDDYEQTIDNLIKSF